MPKLPQKKAVSVLLALSIMKRPGSLPQETMSAQKAIVRMVLAIKKGRVSKPDSIQVVREIINELPPERQAQAKRILEKALVVNARYQFNKDRPIPPVSQIMRNRATNAALRARKNKKRKPIK